MVLSPEHIESYREDGYTVVSNLIPEEIIDRAVASLWTRLGMDPDKPDSWKQPPPPPPTNAAWHLNASPARIEHLGLTDAALLACCTPEYRAATRALATFAPGAFCCQREYPEAVWSMNQFPSSTTPAPPPHLDGGHRHLKITPGPFRMITLIYLSDVEPHGGGTMVWPGSNRKFRNLAQEQPGQYSHMNDLRPLVADLAQETPVEIIPQRGDVVFIDYLMVHSGSLNRSAQPRLALRFLCSCPECEGWNKVGKWNVWNP